MCIRHSLPSLTHAFQCNATRICHDCMHHSNWSLGFGRKSNGTSSVKLFAYSRSDIDTQKAPRTDNRVTFRQLKATCSTRLYCVVPYDRSQQLPPPPQPNAHPPPRQQRTSEMPSTFQVYTTCERACVCARARPFQLALTLPRAHSPACTGAYGVRPAGAMGSLWPSDDNDHLSRWHARALHMYIAFTPDCNNALSL